MGETIAVSHGRLSLNLLSELLGNKFQNKIAISEKSMIVASSDV
jgi:hypothetical protein